MKKIFFIFIAILLFLTACGGEDFNTNTSKQNSIKKDVNKTNEKNDTIKKDPNKVYKIMPLGDSITYDDAHAYYDSNGKNLVPAGKRTAYRSFLAWDLNDAGIKYHFVGSRSSGYDIKPKFDPYNEGHPGWTSFDISKRVYRYLEHRPPDIVLLHIGTNDKAGGRIDGVKKILDEIKRFERNHKTHIHVFVALIINRKFWDRTIEKYNVNLRNMIINMNDPEITLVDMTHILNSNDYLENTHPNKHGYKKIADKWFIALTDYLLN